MESAWVHEGYADSIEISNESTFLLAKKHYKFAVDKWGKFFFTVSSN